MIQGARKLPTMHCSVRVPWHDRQWDGTVCANPRGNTSCLALPRIAEKKDDDAESRPEVAGQLWNREGVGLPACAAERGAFMAPFDYVRRVNHPYSRNDLYSHFDETVFRHPKYSVAAVAFAWMMKERDGIPAKASAYGINFQPEREPNLEFDRTWVQERTNQLAMLDTFFSAIQPEESLVFCYAKQTPITDDRRRVIVGIGRVLNVADPVEYRYKKDAPANGIRCVLWERNITHSIRPTMEDGFLLPYHDLAKLAEKDPSIDLAGLVLHAPEEHWDAFSMGSEHVTHDQAITVLIACAALIDRLEKLLPGDWRSQRAWVDNQLNRIWRLRGAFPGLGSALTAFGVTHGTLVAHAIGQRLHADGSHEVRDPWPSVADVFKKPSLLPSDLAANIGSTTARLWTGLEPDRRALLQLLSRFELTSNQATRWFITEERTRAGITLSDKDILTNPYRCFEADREQEDPIPLRTIDRGLFPDQNITAAIPVPEPSACSEAIDPRRGRALCIAALDYAADQGHTLLPQTWLVQRVRDMDISAAMRDR